MLILNYIMKNYKISFRDLNYHGLENPGTQPVRYDPPLHCNSLYLYEQDCLDIQYWQSKNGRIRLFWSIYQCLEKKVDNKHIYHDMKLEILFI